MRKTAYHYCLEGAKFEKNEKFWARFSEFFEANGYFGPNLNHSVQYFGAKLKFHTLETQLRVINWIKVFVSPLNLLENFYLIYF